MGKRCRVLLVSSCILFFIAIAYSPADEFFIANLQVVRPDKVAESTKSEDEIKLALTFQEELLKISTPAITYRPLESLPKETLGDLQGRVIMTTLDALAVCFFINVDNLVYGTVNIGENNVYEASLHLYNRIASRVVDEFVYSNPAGDEKAYFAGLAAKLNEHLKIFIQSPPPKPVIQETKQPPTEPAPSPSPLPTNIKADDKLDVIKTDSQFIDPQINPDTDILNVQEPLPPEDNNKPLIIFISAGYFFPIIGEWKDKTMPCVSIEQGVKFPTPWVETEDFDLMFQVGYLFNYSFALNKPENPYYTHFHSLTGKISLELDFEFNNFFSIFIGGGPEYKFQIIDYVNLANYFFTDIPYAFGLFGDVGLEFLIGKNRAMAIGITNIFDFTFLAHPYVDYKAHLHLLLRV